MVPKSQQVRKNWGLNPHLLHIFRALLGPIARLPNGNGSWAPGVLHTEGRVTCFNHERPACGRKCAESHSPFLRSLTYPHVLILAGS